MTVTLSRTLNEIRTVFPLYIFLARLVSDIGVAEYSAVYRIGRICIFQNSTGSDWNTQVQANFTLPEVNNLAVEARSCSLAILIVMPVAVENPNSSSGVNASLVPLDLTSYASRAGEYCLCGKVPLESLYNAWDSSPNFRLGQRAEIMSTVDLFPCILKTDFPNEDKSISIEFSCNSENLSTSKQVQITISAQEFGAKEKSIYNTYLGSGVPSSLLSHIIRLRDGNVVFNYRYYDNKLQKIEVTEDFSCPFCLVKCASFKGLRYHLSLTHDLFDYEFWVSEECQAVNVSLKTDIWVSKIVADGGHAMSLTFCFCAKPLKRRRPKNLSFQNAKNPTVLESDFPAGDTEHLEKVDGASNAIIQSHPDPDFVQSISEYDHGTLAVLQSAKRRKLSVEHSESSDLQNCALLRKRQFFHSRTAQPMALEQVLADHDSEDEVDDEVADIEDQRMLDNLVGVSKYEKQMMHMWNSFVRKQRVLADGHIPWACEAFSKFHSAELVRSPSLTWCWRLFMIKLWNHGLLDARTINQCNLILEQYQRENPDLKS